MLVSAVYSTISCQVVWLEGMMPFNRETALLLLFSFLWIGCSASNVCPVEHLQPNFIRDPVFQRVNSTGTDDFDSLLGWWIDGSQSSVSTFINGTLALQCSTRATGLHQFVAMRAMHNTSSSTFLEFAFDAIFDGGKSNTKMQQIYPERIGAQVQLVTFTNKEVVSNDPTYIHIDKESTTRKWKTYKYEFQIDSNLPSFLLIHFTCTSALVDKESKLYIWNPILKQQYKSQSVALPEPIRCFGSEIQTASQATQGARSQLENVTRTGVAYNSFTSTITQGKPITIREIHTSLPPPRIRSNAPVILGIAYHASLDRIGPILRAIDTFGGDYVSVALYATESELTSTKALKIATEFAAKLPSSKSSIEISLVITGCVRNNRLSCEYPINLLRNQAMFHLPEQVNWVVNLDADMIPCDQFYPNLVRQISHTINDSNKLQRVAFVIPALEQVDGSTDITLLRALRSKQGLARAIERGAIAPYKHQHATRAHGATNVPYWLKSDKAYPVQFVPQYEPYVALQLNAPYLPYFDESFVGYGWNKVFHVMMLHTLQYNFVVLPDVWIIHESHQKTKSSRQFSYDTSVRFRNRMTRYIALWKIAHEFHLGPCGKATISE